MSVEHTVVDLRQQTLYQLLRFSTAWFQPEKTSSSTRGGIISGRVHGEIALLWSCLQFSDPTSGSYHSRISNATIRADYH